MIKLFEVVRTVLKVRTRMPLSLAQPAEQSTVHIEPHLHCCLHILCKFQTPTVLFIHRGISVQYPPPWKFHFLKVSHIGLPLLCKMAEAHKMTPSSHLTLLANDSDTVANTVVIFNWHHLFVLHTTHCSHCLFAFQVKYLQAELAEEEMSKKGGDNGKWVNFNDDKYSDIRSPRQGGCTLCRVLITIRAGRWWNSLAKISDLEGFGWRSVS